MIEISKEVVEAFAAIADGKPFHITGVRICDHCKDKNKEAFPYCVNDSHGAYWEHLCNDCFELLGCSYEDRYLYPGFPPQICEHCGKELEDFSDLGCEYCDVRHPHFGLLP